jgi:O-antigen/teichoic acid export membrane protein
MFSENMLAFFGNDYSENASELLKIFSITSIPYTINLFYITTKRIQKEVINIICVYAFIGLFTIIGGYYLVSYYNLIGIALAWGIANGIIAIFISIIMCLRHISEKYAKRH